MSLKRKLSPGAAANLTKLKEQFRIYSEQQLSLTIETNRVHEQLQDMNAQVAKVEAWAKHPILPLLPLLLHPELQDLILEFLYWKQCFYCYKPMLMNGFCLKCCRKDNTFFADYSIKGNMHMEWKNGCMPSLRFENNDEMTELWSVIEYECKLYDYQIYFILEGKCPFTWIGFKTDHSRLTVMLR